MVNIAVGLIELQNKKNEPRLLKCELLKCRFIFYIRLDKNVLCEISSVSETIKGLDALLYRFIARRLYEFFVQRKLNFLLEHEIFITYNIYAIYNAHGDLVAIKRASRRPRVTKFTKYKHTRKNHRIFAVVHAVIQSVNK